MSQNGKLIRSALWLSLSCATPFAAASCSSSSSGDDTAVEGVSGNAGSGGGDGTGATGGSSAGHSAAGHAGSAGLAGGGGQSGSKGGASGSSTGGSKGGASGSSTGGSKGGSGAKGGTGTAGAGGMSQGLGGAAPGAGGMAVTGGNGGAGQGGDETSQGGQVAQGGNANAGGSGGGFDVTHAPSTLGSFTTQGSTGCAMPGAATGFQSVNISINGSMRTGSIFVPDDYDADKAYPIVFVFHGDGGTGAGIRASLNLEPDAAGKAIFAYPDGANETWDSTESGDNADMDLVMSLRDQLRTTYCVDTKRTFLTGMSRGGFFVNQLSCRYGIAEFAAVAPHSSTIDAGDDNAYVYGPPNPNGGPYVEGDNYDFACPSDGLPYPAHPIPPAPAFVIHGECDQEGGVEYPQGRRVAEHWGYAASCSTTPAVAVTTSPNPSCAANQLTSSPVLTVDPCYVAPGCGSGHDVTFCAIPSMDHRVWSEAHSRIWSFFAAH